MKSHHPILMQSNRNLKTNLGKTTLYCKYQEGEQKKQQHAYQTNLKCLDSNSKAGAWIDSGSTILFYPIFENIAEPTST